MNLVALVGNITKDPELKKTQENKSVVNFTLAINEGKDKAEFVMCQAWERNADLIAQYIHKGQKLGINGKLHTSSWEAQNGEKKSMTFVRVDRVEFLSAKESAQPEADSIQQVEVQPKPQPQYQEQHLSYQDIKADDLPFY